METIVGLFDTYEQADQAVQALYESGYQNQEISVLMRQKPVSDQLEDDPGEDVVKKTGIGAASGGVAGGLAGLLVGLGVLVIPGIGPAVAAGTLAAALGTAATGAGIGAISGGMLGALAAVGIPREQAEVYAEGVKRGGVVVMVEVEPGRGEVAQTLMKQAGAVDVEDRRAQWLEDGWVHFDEQVYPPSEFPGGISTK
jgi:uncharacterized membrane protein